MSSLKDHCHLGTTNPPTATRYPVRFGSQHAERPNIIASAKRALSGKLHFHTLSSAGVPCVFRDFYPVIQVDSETDKQTIIGLLGRLAYYVPPYHQDSGDVPQPSSIKTVRVAGVQLESSDPREQYWWITVHLVDAATVSTS